MVRKVQVEVVKAHELDPNKKYLIELSDKSWSMEDAQYLAKAVHDIGSTVVVAMNRGSGNLKIVELPTNE